MVKICGKIQLNPFYRQFIFDIHSAIRANGFFTIPGALYPAAISANGSKGKPAVAAFRDEESQK